MKTDDDRNYHSDLITDGFHSRTPNRSINPAIWSVSKHIVKLIPPIATTADDDDAEDDNNDDVVVVAVVGVPFLAVAMELETAMGMNDDDDEDD